MPESQFIRVIRRREVLLLSFGAMIGWSWVLLTGSWIGRAGTLGAISAFMFGGLAIVLIGLVYAELVAAMPRAGGEHVYTYRALGPAASFVCTWCLIMAYITVPTFEAVALPQALAYIFPNLEQGYLWTVADWDVYLLPALIGSAAAVIVTVVNILGIKFTAFVQSLTTLVILAVGALLVLGAVSNGDSDNMQPLFDNGLNGFIGVMIIVPMMFMGFDVIPQSAEEINLPPKLIGKILMFSVMMALAWYCLMILSVGLALDGAGRAASTMSTADASAAAWGTPLMGNILVIGGIAGILTSWNAFVLGGSRALYAMAKSGMLPAALGRLHSRYRTPYNAILLIGVLSAIAPFAGRSLLVWLIDAGSFMLVLSYCMVCWAFLRLRKREPDMPRPFRVGYGEWVGRTALLMGLGILLMFFPGSPAALIWPYEWLMVLAWAAVGLLFYRGFEPKEDSPE